MNDAVAQDSVETNGDGELERWTTRLTSLEGLIILAVICVTVQRVALGIDLPLWLDETWTVMIASEPTWKGFWREAWLDVNAPLYYVIMKLWVDIVGLSNTMMRLPSLVFLYAAAALPLVWKSHGLDRSATLTWSALMVLWWPGIMMTLDARSYTFLMLASVAGLIAFTQAWRNGTSKSFALWAAIGSVQLLTHYFAYFLVATQGLILLWQWRFDLVKRCYAFAPFLLPFAWTLYHLPRFSEYGRPGVAWYDPTSFSDAIRYTMFSFGAPTWTFALLLGVVLLAVAHRFKGVSASKAVPVNESSARGSDKGILWAVAAAAIALAIIFAVTSVKASLTDRYLVPLVPAFLLGVVVLGYRAAGSGAAYRVIVLLYAVFALTPFNLSNELTTRTNYGYERESDFVALSKPEHLIFLWDHPNGKILDEQSLEKIGSFFLRRQGIEVNTTALRLSEFDNPNQAIIDAVKHENTGVIWLYDGRRRSAAAHHPPVLAKVKGWRCADRRSFLPDKKTKQLELWVGTIGCTTGKAEDAK